MVQLQISLFEEITLDNNDYFLSDPESQSESYRYVLKTNHVTLTHKFFEIANR